MVFDKQRNMESKICKLCAHLPHNLECIYFNVHYRDHLFLTWGALNESANGLPVGTTTNEHACSYRHIRQPLGDQEIDAFVENGT